jgi:predicted metal-dependent phosphoesterase TrpH
LIDLHLHTTASDGTLAPSDLVARAAAAGLTVISVTDHDTVAGIPEARAAALARGLRLVSGVEITAIEADRDVHLLGYFMDEENPAVVSLLERQRATRIRRVREIGDRLTALGCPVDLAPLLASAAASVGRSVGRPLLADALVAAGHARDRNDAFDRWLGADRPAFVPRTGPSPAEVIRIVGQAGGICSLAHPGLTRIDEAIGRFADAGLAALEVRHTEHDPETEARYRALAAVCGLAVSGGSDFHGADGHRVASLGVVTLSAHDFASLEARRP